MKDLLEPEAKMVYYWGPDGVSQKLGLLVEEDSKGTCVIQPLPAIHGPLPSTVKRKASVVTAAEGPIDMARVRAHIDAAKKVSASRAVETRAAFDKIRERLDKIPKEERPPKKSKALVMAKRYKLVGKISNKNSKFGWATSIVACISKAKQPLTLPEIEAAIERPESKMDTKTAVAWYVNDLCKKKVLEAV